MKHLQQLLALCGFVLCSGIATSSLAADSPSAGNKAPERDKMCTGCHNESWPKPILSIYQTRHGVTADTRTPACQSCHGASDAHLKTPENPPDVVFGANSKRLSSPDVRNTACLSCHESRVLARTNWAGSQHQTGGVACSNCHDIHAPTQRVLNKRTQPEVCYACHKEQRADSRKISHHPIGEGKVVCSDCHNPHGSAGPKLLKKNTVNETCFTCHAEKRGPFLWEHQPVTEDCTNCHTPHGSNITPLLKSRAPFLCEECHNGPHQSATPAAGNVAGIQGGLTGAAGKPVSPGYAARSCMNCHVMVHGSNSPSGSLLHR